MEPIQGGPVRNPLTTRPLGQPHRVILSQNNTFFHIPADSCRPRDGVQRVVEAVAGHPGAEIHVQEQAGHAFHNHAAPMFHNPEAAAVAWKLTTEFLARTLPTR